MVVRDAPARRRAGCRRQLRVRKCNDRRLRHAARLVAHPNARTYLRAPTVACFCALLGIAALCLAQGAIAAASDTAFTNTFASLSGSGWVGGDGTNSVALPDGRDCWLFSDTITATSPAGLTVAHNSIVVTGGQHPQVIANPMPQPAPDAFYWAGAARVQRTQVWEIAQRIVQTGPGLWDFHFAGNYLAKINISDWTLTSITPLTTTIGGPINWGVAILDYGPYTYIYGSESQGLSSWMHVARVPKGRLDARWSYYTGLGWTHNAAALRAAACGCRARILGHRSRLRSRDPRDHTATNDGTGDLLLAGCEPRRTVQHEAHDLQHRQLRRTDLHLQHTRAPRTDNRQANAVLIQRQQLRRAHAHQRDALPPTFLPRPALSTRVGSPKRPPTRLPEDLLRVGAVGHQRVSCTPQRPGAGVRRLGLAPMTGPPDLSC